MDESFVECNKATNNNILQKLCGFGKFGASSLEEFMARHSQIPYVPSCINLIHGLVNKDRVEEATKILKIVVMSGGFLTLSHTICWLVHCAKREVELCH